MYIFLDESGQFTRHNDDEYFIVAAFTVGDYRRTGKALRKWYKSKFPRKMKTQPEIKFSDRRISAELRLKTLKYISNLDVRVNYVYLLRKNIPEDYRYKDRLLSGHLYTKIIGELLEMFLPTEELEFRAFCDEGQLKGIRRSDFKKMLRAQMLPLLPAGSIVEIEMIDSISNVNIQIADWIVGALAWSLENRKLGAECGNILKNNIIGGGKELFKQSWEERHKQKDQLN